MFFKDFVSVKRQKIKRGASQTYDTPSFRSTENSGHEGSKSLRVIIIFKPQRFRSWSFSVIKDFLGGQNANTLVTNRMPFDTYNLSVELRISKGVMKGLCLFMSLSQ